MMTRKRKAAIDLACASSPSTGVVPPRKLRNDHADPVVGKQKVCDEADDASTGPSRLVFLALPRELRDQVYRELYVHSKPIAIQQTHFHLAVSAFPRIPLRLSRTCKQIRAESMQVFWTYNTFTLDLNILTSLDWLSSIPSIYSRYITSINLAKTIMTGYVRYDLGLFDSSRLRQDLVKRLVYDLNLKTISIEVPDEYNPQATHQTMNLNGGGGTAGAGAGAGAAVNNGPNAAQNANTWFNLSFHPRHDFSWALVRELLEVLIEGGFENLRLLYHTKLPRTEPKDLISLYAMSRVLWLDDEFEVEGQVKRIETARRAGRRSEFSCKADVENFVKARRRTRQFCIGYTKTNDWESGSAVDIRQAAARTPPATSPKFKQPHKLWDVQDLLKLPGAIESLKRDY